MVEAATPDPHGRVWSFAEGGGVAEPVGSVADEAARLVHVLAARGTARAGSASRAASTSASWATAETERIAEEPGLGTRQPGESTAADFEGPQPSAGDAAACSPDARRREKHPQDGLPADGRRRDEHRRDEHPHDPDAARGDPPGRCQACGCAGPEVCAACPICRAAGVVRLFSPQVLDAVADLAGLAAGALREAAARQREAGGRHQGSRGGGDAPGSDARADTVAEPTTPPGEEY